MLTHAGIGLSEVVTDGADLYWVESRPIEAGRSVIVRRRADGTIEDVSPPGFNTRTRAHEYGGGAYAVGGGVIISSVFRTSGSTGSMVANPGRSPRTRSCRPGSLCRLRLAR